MRTIAAISFALFAFGAFAQDADLINADRPGIADGSAVVGRGIFQLEFGLERDHNGGGRSLSSPVLFRYGMTRDLELRIEGDGYIRERHANGFAPVAIGVKYHFGQAPSMGVIASVSVPSGTGEQRSHETNGIAVFTTDINLGEKWSLNPNAGLASQDDGDGRFTAGILALTVQYNVSDRTNVFVDGAMQTQESRGGGESLVVDAGAAWIVGSNTQFDVSIGWRARGTTTPNVFVGAGISRRF